MLHEATRPLPDEASGGFADVTSRGPCRLSALLLIFSEFMDKEWGEVQTEGGKGVNSGGSDLELPSHMIQKSGAIMTQETEAGTPQKAEVSLGQEIEEG